MDNKWNQHTPSNLFTKFNAYGFKEMFKSGFEYIKPTHDYGPYIGTWSDKLIYNPSKSLSGDILLAFMFPYKKSFFDQWAKQPKRSNYMDRYGLSSKFPGFINIVSAEAFPNGNKILEVKINEVPNGRGEISEIYSTITAKFEFSHESSPDIKQDILTVHILDVNSYHRVDEYYTFWDNVDLCYNQIFLLQVIAIMLLFKNAYAPIDCFADNIQFNLPKIEDSIRDITQYIYANNGWGKTKGIDIENPDQYSICNKFTISKESNMEISYASLKNSFGFSIDYYPLCTLNETTVNDEDIASADNKKENFEIVNKDILEVKQPVTPNTNNGLVYDSRFGSTPLVDKSAYESQIELLNAKLAAKEMSLKHREMLINALANSTLKADLASLASHNNKKY